MFYTNTCSPVKTGSIGSLWRRGNREHLSLLGMTSSAATGGAYARYSFGRRFRPPRGTMYMNAIKATMTTAAIATMATVDAATITRDPFPGERS